jgi:hypothetical protein
VCDADDERQGEKPRANREEIGAVELSQKLTAAVDTWAANRHITRADAIRRLVELGLHAKPHAAPPGAARLGPLILENLAMRRISEMLDPSLAPKERERRIRRLIEGPPEFSRQRIDLPKHGK